MASEVQLNLVDGLKFDVHTRSGHTLRIDTTEASGGEGSAPTPMELQLAALGGCGAMDVLSILRKMRQPVTAYSVRVTAERASEHPRVYTSAVITHRFRGCGINEAHVRRAIWLSMSKYCPVYATLAPRVDIREFFEITDEEGGPVLTGEVTLTEESAPVAR